MSKGTGIETSGGSLNWRNIISSRDEDPIVSALMKDALNIFVNNTQENEIVKKYNINDVYFKETNNFFKKKNLPTIFDIEVIKSAVETNNKKKKKEKPLSNKEKIKLQVEQANIKKITDKFISNLEIDKNLMPLSKNILIESLLNIVYWALHILKNKSNEKVKPYLLFDCSISLYRAISDCNDIIDDEIKEKLYGLLNRLEDLTKYAR